MNKASYLGLAALIALMAFHNATAQTTNTNTSGSTDASITTSTTEGTTAAPQPPARTSRQQQQTPRTNTSVPPVTNVRPLSQEDIQRQQAASARRRPDA